MQNYIRKILTNFYSRKDRNSKILILLVGILSTLWFLFRVIPKPSRASYPCVRAAAPFMTTFIVWISGMMASLVVFKKARRFFKESRYMLGFLALAAALSFAIYAFNLNPVSVKASELFMEEYEHPANEPVGTALDVAPGRVVWTWNPDATNSACTQTVNKDGYIDEDDDVYFLRKNNDEKVIKDMMAFSIRELLSVNTTSEAWDMIFHFHNVRKWNDYVGYQSGETFYIKTNNQGIGLSHTFSSDLRQEDKTVWGSFPPHMTATSPYSILAVIDQLVNEAGVPEDMIYVGDPHNNFNNIYFEIINDEFPDVNVIGINGNKVVDCEDHGRTLSIKSNVETVFYSDRGSVLGSNAKADKLYLQLEEADYVINIAALKGHLRGGVTMFAKSHFGSHTRDAASHLHPGLVAPDQSLPMNEGYGKYRVLTDIMGHEKLGGNTMLYVLDALWGGKPHELREPRKYDMAPFNGDYTSSLFLSLDPVAISSVGFDFLRTEYNTDDWGDEAFPNYYGTDDYLHQAADPELWADGIIYDPEDDGTPMGSLGVHEHWNNASDKQYSRNLDPVGGKGIELLQFTREDILNSIPGFMKDHQEVCFYPNPVVDYMTIDLQELQGNSITLSIINLNGQQILSRKITGTQEKYELSLDSDLFTNGVYVLTLEGKNKIYSSRFMVKR